MTVQKSRFEMPPLSVVVLAAGESKRMKSNLTKVLHPLGGTPMIFHVLRSVQALNPDTVVLVVGKNREPVEAALDGQPVVFADQKKPLGTAHALLSAREALLGFRGDLLVLCGDTPLIRSRTLDDLVSFHRAGGNDATLLTCRFHDPHGYGRIIRHEGGAIASIVEETEATGDQREILEINTGIYCFKSPTIFGGLEKICSGRPDHEFYLTDIVSIYDRDGLRVDGMTIDDEKEVMGINTRSQLDTAEEALGDRI